MKRGNDILQAWEQRILDERNAVVVTTRCAWCKWTTKGTVQETRQKYAEHRATKHPERPVKERRQRARPFRQFNSAKDLDTNIDNARKQGAAGWAGPE